MISDWDYLLDDGSDLAQKIKQLVDDMSYLCLIDYWSLSPAETVASIGGETGEELETLLDEYS